MAQLPFTDVGVARKLQELYALSDADLAAQVRSIYTDLSGWLSVNFILTSQQQTYLASAPPLVRGNWAGMIGSAISGRQRIIMKAPPTYGPPRRTKQIIIDIFGALRWFPPVSGPGALEGDLTINIDWAVVD